jgi:hypothetical protein
MSDPRDDPAVQAVRLATLCADLRRLLARAAERAQQISELADALGRQP